MTGSGLRAESQKVVTSAAVWLPGDPCGGGIVSSSAQSFRPTAGQYLSGGVSALRWNVESSVHMLGFGLRETKG